MRLARYGLTLIILLFWASTTSYRVEGIPEYAKDLPSDLKNFCNVCHEKASGGPLNRFGFDYKGGGRDIMRVSELDSDGDGFSNRDELDSGTFPGDPSSFPGSSKRTLNWVLILALICSAAILFMLFFRSRRG